MYACMAQCDTETVFPMTVLSTVNFISDHPPTHILYAGIKYGEFY